MLENRLKESGCDLQVNKDNRLGDLAWKPETIGEAKASGAKVALETMGLSRRTENDKLKNHIPINDRCSLDIYEHHWELAIPKVTVQYSKPGLRMNSNGKPEMVVEVKAEKEIITHEKLMMDDQGIWTMKDDQGHSVAVDRNTTDHGVKLKVFTNGATVEVARDGIMTLVRDQDHVYASKKGTPAFDEERNANSLVVRFSKKDGVTTVVDQNKLWTIEKAKPSP